MRIGLIGVFLIYFMLCFVFVLVFLRFYLYVVVSFSLMIFLNVGCVLFLVCGMRIWILISFLFLVVLGFEVKIGLVGFIDVIVFGEFFDIKENFVVVRLGVVFLRVVGKDIKMDVDIYVWNDNDFFDVVFDSCRDIFIFLEVMMGL